MKRFDWRGRHVLITGAAGGIGAALARRLRRDHGCGLSLVDRDAAGLGRLRDELSSLGGGAAVDLFETDLASRGALGELVARLGDRRVEVLVNGAGIGPVGAFAAMDVERIDAVLEINLRAAVVLTRLLLPRLLESGRAWIVNVASAAGLAAPAGLCAYATSKFGLVGFSEALRVELRDRGVGVTVVCPGFVRTDFVRNTAAVLGDDGPAQAARLARLNAEVRRRGIEPDEVAAAIVDAVRDDRGRVVLGALNKGLLALRAVHAPAADRINLRSWRRLRREDGAG